MTATSKLRAALKRLKRPSLARQHVVVAGTGVKCHVLVEVRASDLALAAAELKREE